VLSLINPERAVEAAIAQTGSRRLFAQILSCAGARDVEIVGQYRGLPHLRAMRLDNSTHINIHPRSILSLRIDSEPFTG